MELKNLPDITFAESDPQTIEGNIITTVEGLLGRKLARADPLRLFLRGIEALIIQQRILIDATAKQNLLAFATGEYLDHIGALTGTYRLQPSAATATIRLQVSSARGAATLIPQGTRVTAGDGTLFALDDAAVIKSGEMSVDARATCTETGAKGNGYLAGELNRLVDPVPFVATVKNTTASAGGADEEDDESFRKRIHEAPERYSTAGPVGAYEYFTKESSALVTDVSVDSPAPTEVVVYPLLTGGEVPGSELLETISAALNNRTVRPLTDKVTVKPPTKVTYNVTVSYWIDRSDATEAANIQRAAQQAVADYVLWQKSKLGRDVNPTELYYRLRSAGVKRAEITEPEYMVITRAQVAVAGTIGARFEGLEDD